MQPEDFALLRSLVEWRRANGWTLERSDAGYVQWTSRDGWSVDVYLPGGAEMTVESATRRFGVWYPLTVTAAVDVLVAVGVVPPELSSVFRAGRESAYTADEWRVVAVHPRSGELLMNEQRGEVAVRALLKAAQTFDPGARLEHRRTGATDWSRVDELQA